MDTVDDQLEVFETYMAHELTYHFISSLDRGFWEAMDELDRESRDLIPLILRGVLNTLAHRYRHTAVTEILENAYTVLLHAAVTGLNVPFPRNYVLHIEAVVDNLVHVYIQTSYVHLRTEMIMVNHSAGVIQRAWKRCVSDPGYAVCRRRLVREFKNLEYV